MASQKKASWAKRLGLALGALLLVFVLFIAYGTYRERTAKPKAEQFCASVKIGGAVNSLSELAIASGADDRQTKWIKTGDGIDWLPVTYIGMPPFSRHICSIEAKGVVLSAEYLHLD